MSQSNRQKGFEFIGFDPARNLTDKASERFIRVFCESPSDSAAHASLRKTQNGFEGYLRISSTVGTFVASVIGHDPAAVITKLTRKVRSQLRIWKRARVF